MSRLATHRRPAEFDAGAVARNSRRSRPSYLEAIRRVLPARRILRRGNLPGGLHLVFRIPRLHAAQLRHLRAPGHARHRGRSGQPRFRAPGRELRHGRAPRRFAAGAASMPRTRTFQQRTGVDRGAGGREQRSLAMGIPDVAGGVAASVSPTRSNLSGSQPSAPPDRRARCLDMDAESRMGSCSDGRHPVHDYADQRVDRIHPRCAIEQPRCVGVA